MKILPWPHSLKWSLRDLPAFHRWLDPSLQLTWGHMWSQFSCFFFSFKSPPSSSSSAAIISQLWLEMANVGKHASCFITRIPTTRHSIPLLTLHLPSNIMIFDISINILKTIFNLRGGPGLDSMSPERRILAFGSEPSPVLGPCWPPPEDPSGLGAISVAASRCSTWRWDVSDVDKMLRSPAAPLICSLQVCSHSAHSECWHHNMTGLINQKQIIFTCAHLQEC